MVRVSIVMGSDSDLPIMEKAAQLLEEMDIEHEMRIISAHRTPEEAREFASTARERGVQVIIAGAGMAAHLAGAMAAHTHLPIIGVPLSGSSLAGQDALLATVQMPPGLPVATMAIDGSRNAGIMACQILALQDQEVEEKLLEFRRSMAERVRQKDAKLS